MSNVVSLKPDSSEPQPPASIEAEQALLGAILVNNAAWGRVADFLKAEHFFEEIHARIYSVTSDLLRGGKLATPITLRTFLGEHSLGPITVPQYLARLAAEATTVINAADYGRMIVDLAIRREIIEAADKLKLSALNARPDAPPAELAISAIGVLQEIGLTAAPSNTRVDPGTAAASLIARAKRIMSREPVEGGVSTGLRDLDNDTGGFEPGTLWVMGGRPGMGKTVMATGFALKVANRGAKDIAAGALANGAMLFSLEVPERQVTARLLSDLAWRSQRPIPFGSIMRGALDEQDVWCIEEAQERLAILPLALDCASRLKIDEIRLRIRAEKARMARKGVRLGVVFIDYLKFVAASDRYRGQRVYEVGEISGALKQIAKDEDLCVVLLAQLNRALEHRDRKDRRPTLSDIRESGDLEADADVVAFIHRESYYIKQSPEYRNCEPDAMQQFIDLEHEAEIILGKTRAGPTGTIKIWCDIGCSKFTAVAGGGFV